MRDKTPYSAPGVIRRSHYLTIATVRDLTDAFDKIAGVVSNEFGTTKEAIKLKNNKKQFYVKPRQICMFLLHYGCGYGPSAIAEACGGWDHATVIRALQAVEARRDTDKAYKEKLREIINIIYEQYSEILIVGKSMLNEFHTQS